MPNDLSAALLTLAIVVGSLWLAVDYARQRARWFAWLWRSSGWRRGCLSRLARC